MHIPYNGGPETAVRKNGLWSGTRSTSEDLTISKLDPHADEQLLFLNNSLFLKESKRGKYWAYMFTVSPF